LLGAYVRDGTATPATTEAYARALAASGRAEEADGLLKPLATGSSPWRQAWLSIIADTAPSVADGTARVARVEPLLAAGSVDDRVAVAGAWFTLGSRFDDAAALRRGLDELDPLSDVSSVPTDALLLTGALHQQLNELPEAEEAYRKALAANPALPRAMNNLAWVIVLRNGDLSESRRLAERAVALLPGNADVRTTLGQVALKQGDVPTAAEAFRTATRLSPRSAAAWAGLADAEARAGHTGDAAGALGRAEQLLAPPAPRPSSATTAELQRARAALGRPAQGGPRTVRPVG
jgi:tetratricopeptide (TPR) repeat protein